MNIKILDSWLRDYLKTDAKPSDLQTLLSLSGPAIERIEEVGADNAYDIEVTTNRVDANCVYGIAREAATILKHQGIAAKLLPYQKANVEAGESIVTIEDPNKLTKRLLALVIEDVKVKPSSPEIQARLSTSGVRSLNNLIDITNYVMLELGHPVHVFDLDRIKTNKLVLRLAKKGEELITLDNKKHVLGPDDVVITDGTDRIIDLPGIMGCENSVVTEKTTRILVFVESNDPVRIRKTSMRHAIRTLAAAYNENEPDPELAKEAILRCAHLYQTEANGQFKGGLVDLNYLPSEAAVISLSVSQVEAYTGKQISQDEIAQVLIDLGFSLEKTEGETAWFKVPTWRAKDVTKAVDLIEEVARIYGYSNLPTNLPPFKFISDEYIRAEEKKYKTEVRVKYLLADLGFFELYNYSMISPDEQALYNLGQKPISMVNPMSQELVSFRQSLVPSLVKDVLINKGVKGVKLFEAANVYLPRPKNLPFEKKTLGLVINGSLSEMKGYLQTILSLGHLPVNYDRYEASYLEQGLAARVLSGEKELGYAGVLNKELQHKLGLNGEYVVAEIDLSELASLWQVLKPIVMNQNKQYLIEDLTYIYDGKVTWSEIIASLQSQFSEIQKIELAAEFENNITMRLYSQVKEGQSILKSVYEFLESKFSLNIKRSK